MASDVLSDSNMSDGENKEVIEPVIEQLRGRNGVNAFGCEPDTVFALLPSARGNV